MKFLLLASKNQGKIKEIKSLLADLPYKIKTMEGVNIKDKVEEKGTTYEENALLKAKTIGDKTKMLTIGEDSGLEIDALDGWPGIYSARHTIGTDEDKIDAILKKMADIPQEKRTARYQSVVAIYIPIDLRHSGKRSANWRRAHPESDSGPALPAGRQARMTKKGKIYTFEGSCDGFITHKKEGNNGFGYDPIFWSNDLKKSFGNASDEEKNLVSHRAQAILKLKKFLT